MTPQLLTRSQINDGLWNHLIEESQQSVLYAFTNYLDLVCEDWNAFVWPEMGDYKIVMPIPVRLKMGMRVAYQPLFCQYLGIFSKSDLHISDMSPFLQAFAAQFKYISGYHFNPENYLILSKCMELIPHIEIATCHTHWLNLLPSYECVVNGFSTDRKKNLEKGNRYGWEVMKSRNIHPLIFLFVQNHAGKIPGGVNPCVYNRLEAVFERLEAIGKAEVWYAHYEGIIRAGILLIRNADRVIYLFNAADEMGRKGNARTFLLASYFRLHAREPLVFDFETPEVSSVTAFYESFGSTAVPYLKVRQNRLWFPLRMVQNLRRRLYLKTR
ncbi:GNAT family N-acetyltransferase [Dyadobacter sp. CY323]|uniref:GNAT family N-acetyltransferase n=1 Tax=Dyadobacter sp. CY323 TaxID=2907302 RepID=UPI001F23D7F2|nr:GNAT family N-acetyltransferase [Dyadobacter sp. CY323]MCE6992564.1 GNAT family N-acetyltransferase [Dyadobacter sp. CY323]